MSLTLIKSPSVVIGGNSTINLLPPEVINRRKLKVFHRRVAFLLFIFVLLIFGCVALVKAEAIQAERDLAIVQANASYLQSQQDIFSEVRTVQDQVESLQAAQQVGAATEIDWRSFLRALDLTLPNGASVDSVNIDQATPFAPYTQPSAPLQGARIATINFTAVTPNLPQIPTWMDSLTQLPGFADAIPGSVIRNVSGSYSVSMTMHLNKAAFTNRFGKAGGTS